MIDGPFGLSGKLKVSFPGGLKKERSQEDNIVTLTCKRFILDTHRKRLRQ